MNRPPEKWDGALVGDPRTSEILGCVRGEPECDGVECYVQVMAPDGSVTWKCCGHLKILS